MLRKSNLFLAVAGLAVVSLMLLFGVHSPIRAKRLEPVREDQQRLVRQLMLTDLCLFTESRYTRHLSQADLFSAFQDHPLSMEHFPSGSMVRPPVILWKKQYEMD